MTKERKSELQKSADRAREMQAAVDKMENNLKVCEKEYEQLQLKMDEALRNLQDTRGLLHAQREKLERELNSVISSACKGLKGAVSYTNCDKVGQRF